MLRCIICLLHVLGLTFVSFSPYLLPVLPSSCGPTILDCFSKKSDSPLSRLLHQLMMSLDQQLVCFIRILGTRMLVLLLCGYNPSQIHSLVSVVDYSFQSSGLHKLITHASTHSKLVILFFWFIKLFDPSYLQIF